MKYINRWGLMRNTINENVAEHSLETAIIAHALAVIGNTYYGKNLDAEHIAVMAMLHDATEIITGDMPTPIKYYAPEIHSSYKKVEATAAKQLIEELPSKMQDEYDSLLTGGSKEEHAYVKAADKLSAYIKCVVESDMGNTDFKKAKESLKKSVDDMDMREIDFFLEHFLDSYTKTLDEINR